MCICIKNNYLLLLCLQVFFPILHADHYYLIAFDLFKANTFIIDNIKRDIDEGKVAYGELPGELVSIKY